MCGIAGWLGEAPADAQALAARWHALLSHRGPDDTGFAAGAGWGLGFNRLSILDLSVLGHQPMQSTDGRYQIVFNGEIYNYLELRAVLVADGEQFRGDSDTEVLLHLLAREGAGALPQLNGMFAFAFIDTVARRFLLARDRLGQKPLYYHRRAGQLRFASELKALLAWPDAAPQLDEQAVMTYLALGYLPTEQCIFHSYQKLPAAHYLSGSLDAPEDAQLVRYWKLNINGAQEQAQTRNGNAAPISERTLAELTDLFSDAVHIRLRSDVPVGIFLSGGIDSGLVATLAGQVHSGTPPTAFTVSFAEAAYDEAALATLVAKQAGLPQVIVPQQANDLQALDRLAWFYDEPFGDPSALPTMALCAAAAAHATVFLSGDGGDEAFGGYRRYLEAQRYPWLLRLPGPVAQGVQLLARTLPRFSALRYQLAKSAQSQGRFAAAFDETPVDPVLALLLNDHGQRNRDDAGSPIWQRWARAGSADEALLARQQRLDYDLYLPDDILVKMDRASMANSIEVRSPLLDYRLVEWAAQLPRHSLLNGNLGKLPLRSLGERLLPPAVQQGRKRGFGVPLDAWFREPGGIEFARSRLLASEAKRRGLWDVAGTEALLHAHQSQRGRNFGTWIWRLLMLDAWARHYVDTQPTQPTLPSWPTARYRHIAA